MKKSLMIISICLILLMTLSVVSAGWFTGWATRTHKITKIVKYGGSTTFKKPNPDIKISILELDTAGEMVKLKFGSFESGFVGKGDSFVAEGWNVEINKVYKRFRRWYVKLKISKTEGGGSGINYVPYESKANINVEMTIKDGKISLPILKADENGWVIGKDSDDRLAISSGNELVYYEKKAGIDYHNSFIVSDDKTKESYVLRANIEEDSDLIRNQTDIEKMTDDFSWRWTEVCSNKYAGKTCYIGNIELTIESVAYTSGGDRSVVLGIGSGNSFNKLYSADGSTIITFN